MDRSGFYRIGEGFVPIGQMSEDQAFSAVGTIAASRQTAINHDHPILETELSLNGARFEALVPPVVRSPAFAIRMRPQKIFTLDHYEKAGIITQKDDPRNLVAHRPNDFVKSLQGLSHLKIIERAVRNRMNILNVGATGSGKTTLANAVLDVVADVTPNDRVVIVEDTIELQCAVRNCVELRAGGNVSLNDCVRACLRLRPTRIVIGEVRGPEALELLKSWSTGHPGGVATVHAKSAGAGVAQFESLVAEATRAPKQTLIAETIQLVIFIDLDANIPAGRKVREVAVVTGYQDGRYVLEQV